MLKQTESWTGRFALAVALALFASQAGFAAKPKDKPVDLVPDALKSPSVAPPPAPPPAVQPLPVPPPSPAVPAPQAVPPMQTVQPLTPAFPVGHWPLAEAKQLLAAIEGAGARGLFSRDYQPEVLKAAIAVGEGEALDQLASRLFAWLATDIRDGRTPDAARVQWFADDPDAQQYPLDAVLRQALDTRNVAAALDALEPAHPDYAALKAELARTPAANSARANLIRVNLERWRWMQRDIGQRYVMANVPEFMVHVFAKGRAIASYRTIVGKLNTPTPQLSEMAEGVIFHPSWYVPQSIIAEGLGAQIARSPAAVKARGYSWTGSGKTLSVVERPGPRNTLGVMKVDMPNPHAIFLHDTLGKHHFEKEVRALSHGCIRTDRAIEFAALLGIMQGGLTPDEIKAHVAAGKTEKVAFAQPIPIFVSYFTLSSGSGGALKAFADLYGRDAPVVASFAKPRRDKASAPHVKEPDAPEPPAEPVIQTTSRP